MNDGQERRYFSVAEANAMIDDLERVFGRMFQMKTQVRMVYARLEEVGCAPGGDDFDPVPADASAEVINDLTTLKTLIDALRTEVKILGDAGCLVKNIDEGIVDWYATRGNRDVLLCWRLGEKEVAYWHDPDTGFAGRRPLSELFDD